MKTGTGKRAEPIGQDFERGQNEERMLPKQGDCFRCEVCGMELQVTVDCNTTAHEPISLQCCGQSLTLVEGNGGNGE
jgi:hypothetical protein